MLHDLILYTQAVAATTPSSFDVVDLIYQTGPVVKLVLVLLVIMSVVSWVIIFSKFFILRYAARQSDKFLYYYQNSSNFGNLYNTTRTIKGPAAKLFRAGYTELLRIKKSRTKNTHADMGSDPESLPTELGVVELVERVLRRTMSAESSRLESYLVFLATVGTTAPFIGLFGTVWGIMGSFIGLAGQGGGTTTLQAVAPGIAEALIATAVGLAAAIPAVVAYNFFINKVRRIDVDMDSFSAEFLNLVEKYFKNI